MPTQTGSASVSHGRAEPAAAVGQGLRGTAGWDEVRGYPERVRQFPLYLRWKLGDRLKLARVADHHRTLGAPEGAGRSLRKRLAGLVDEQPAEFLFAEEAEHAARRRERGGQHGDEKEEGLPGGALRFLFRGPPGIAGEDLAQFDESVADVAGVGLEAGPVQVEGG